MRTLDLPYSAYSWEGSADLAQVPQAIEAIRGAVDDAGAAAAYWKVDNVVVVQGDLRDGAVEAASCAVLALADCTPAGMPHLLELLLQLASGEVRPGHAERAEACRRAVAVGMPLYLTLLGGQYEDIRSLAVDLVGQCVPYCPALSGLAASYLRYCVSDPALSASTRSLAEQWLPDLDE